jgi:chromosome segregation ATPase
MVKKGVLGAALAAGALYLAFGTSAPSYVRTAFHKVRHNAKDAVPVQFEIDRAREEIDRLEPAIRECLETAVRTEVEVEHLDKEITVVKINLAQEEKKVLALRDDVKSKLRLTNGSTASANDADLARRFDHYRGVKQILGQKEATVEAKRKIMESARQQLVTLRVQKEELRTKLQGIEAQLKLIEARKQTNEFNVDDSALSHARQTVDDLERRVEIQSRMADEGRYIESSALGEPSRDVVKEIDEEFGAPSKSKDKSL